jgi:hypothetical protein
MTMDYKSHSAEELRAAQAAGLPIYRLSTNNSGDDDVLIGTYEECFAAILHHHDIDDLRPGWTLDVVDWEIE